MRPILPLRDRQRLTLILAVFIAAAVLAAPHTGAQELYGAAGTMRADSPEAHSYAWLLSYHHRLGEHLDASFTWLNEGHIPGHHRDGHSVQLWAKTRVFNPQLTLAAGVGPYRYFDTTVAESGGSYSDDHGYGVLYSLRATWSGGRWLYLARLDRVHIRKSFDTNEVLFGVGYKLDQDDASIFRGSELRAAARRNELTVYGGLTLVNSYQSDKDRDVAASIEYRHAFNPVFRGSIAWLNEGDPRLVRRNGVVTQGWLEPSFSGDRFTLGVGLGAYVAVDEYREEVGAPSSRASSRSALAAASGGSGQRVFPGIASCRTTTATPTSSCWAWATASDAGTSPCC